MLWMKYRFYDLKIMFHRRGMQSAVYSFALRISSYHEDIDDSRLLAIGAFRCYYNNT